MDIDLIKKAKSGDKEALLQLVMEKQNEYYKLAYVYMGNEQDSLDALADMIVILYENIHKLKKEESFYSWSKTILVNCCKNMLRKKKKIISIETYPEEVYTEEGYGNKEDQILLTKHLSKLNKKHQEVLKLRYYLDLDQNSIAKILKIPVGTVKSRIFEGLKKLKISLGGEIQ